MLVNENDPILKCSIDEYDFENPPVILNNEKEVTLDILTDSMFVAMRINDGVGLAAQQIGQKLRLFIMDIYDEEFICINPQIIEQSDEMVIGKEGCLSFPSLSLSVKRPKRIFASYQVKDGTVIRRWLDDLAARCFCHELDHLNGITFDTKVAALSLKMAKQKRQKLVKQRKRTKT